MKKVILSYMFMILFSIALFGKNDSSIHTFDSMDKIAAQLQKQSDELGDKIKNAQHRIDSIQEAKRMKAENAKLLKPNYLWPIVGGALAGLALALIIRRRKKK